MKGIVFNLFEEFISDNWGDEVYDSLLAACPLHTKEPFVGPGTYPDADLVALLTKACARLEVSPEIALRAFGAFMFPKLAAKFPKFVDGCPDAKSFLMSVHNVIHVEVRKLFKDAKTPSFSYEDPGANQLVINYGSTRKFCHLFEGLLEGVGTHYKTAISFSHASCMHDGAEHCHFDIEFASA